MLSKVFGFANNSTPDNAYKDGGHEDVMVSDYDLGKSHTIS